MMMEVMIMEEVTGCPPKSPIGPMVTVEPGSIAESVVVGVITIVTIRVVGILVTVGISVARANGVAVTGATIRPLPRAIAEGRDFAGNAP